jgi:hypothetical protein
MNNLNKTMDAINELNKTHGVKQRGGKMYTQVVHRMEAFRRHHGTEYGVDTQILVDDGQRVVIKAIITNNDGHTVGSGMAEEIRGQGHVNTTSALENAETSAVGRALASLGLAGGEYASANEMDAVSRKSDAIQSNKAEPVAVVRKPLTEDEAQWLAHNEATLNQYTLKDLEVFMNKPFTKATMQSIKEKDIDAYNDFKTLFVETREKLKEQANG